MSNRDVSEEVLTHQSLRKNQVMTTSAHTEGLKTFFFEVRLEALARSSCCFATSEDSIKVQEE